MAQLMADGGSMRTLRFRERMHLADARNQAQIRLNQEAEYRRAHAASARRRELIRLWGRLAGGVLQDKTPRTPRTPRYEATR